MSGKLLRSGASMCLMALMATACSTNSGSPSPHPDSHLLTEQEIRTASHTDAYSMIQSLRPLWLRQRGPTSFRSRSPIKVYVDNSLLGDVDYLKQISTISIVSIRFMDGLEASNRWGLDHGNGAIMIASRKGN